MLTANGRINTLVYLSNVDKETWTEASKSKLKSAVKLMEDRHQARESKIGEQTRQWIDKALKSASLL